MQTDKPTSRETGKQSQKKRQIGTQTNWELETGQVKKRESAFIELELKELSVSDGQTDTEN